MLPGPQGRAAAVSQQRGRYRMVRTRPYTVRYLGAMHIVQARTGVFRPFEDSLTKPRLRNVCLRCQKGGEPKIRTNTYIKQTG